MFNINMDMSDADNYSEVIESLKVYHEEQQCFLIDDTDEDFSPNSKFICQEDSDCDTCFFRKKVYKLINKRNEQYK